MKSFVLRMTDEEHEQLRKMAEKQGRSMNTIARRKLFGTKIRVALGEKAK